MIATLDHIEGHTFHGRKGAVENRFRYGVDYLVLDAEAELRTPTLFSRNRRNLTSLQDTDHGGVPGKGRGATWVRDALRKHQLPQAQHILLMAQPRVLGHVFNPVSFWLCYTPDSALFAVIAEVTNTYGDRHSYLCHHPDLRPIGPEDRLTATKLMHVSPFQPIEGGYEFVFDIRPDRIGIRIDYTRGKGGLIATLTGTRAPLTNRSILRMAVKRPFGSRRVLGLIHWQALKLWWKGASFRPQPAPPKREVSRG
ncbi:MAG: DUF1365 domain-containing protein [Arenibacterium sp.]